MAQNDTPTVLVLMGVSGCGKSTLAGLLAGALGWDLAEGDDLHPEANVAKMAAGEALTDEDRWPWLDRIAEWIRDRQQAGMPGIVTCSALRRVYRDRIGGPGVLFVHLEGSRDVVSERLSRRLDHFMPQSLLGSQYATLEPLEPDENGIVIGVARRPRELASDLIRRLGLRRLPGATEAITTIPSD
ncbi:gluconokinase [Leucobacter muris]|uniref:Gluconokinase n=1 Tax=Leucobacter muris TaxID=1935379 RepID=A0ABX5QF65_9MICO|nr:gluconokinase [Leucobacter muris]QAB17638.1 gluconokinase [Leucobacter muris]